MTVPNNKTLALIIGHRKQSPGACNTFTAMNEFIFNEMLAKAIQQGTDQVNIKLVYRKTYEKLPADVNALNPDFIISLHCNAYNKEVSGTETLYHHRSTDGKKIAQILNDHIVQALQLNNRGIKAKGVEDRGGYLLKYTHAPCVITEPFFIDNNKDLKTATNKRQVLIDAYISAIHIIAETI